MADGDRCMGWPQLYKRARWDGTRGFVPMPGGCCGASRSVRFLPGGPSTPRLSQNMLTGVNNSFSLGEKVRLRGDANGGAQRLSNALWLV